MTEILIVEDEVRLAAFMEKGLRKNGFATCVAQDGQQAIAMATDHDFDLLLLDLGLPIKDGWTVLRELRQQGKQVPIIIVTALNSENRSVALGFGANDYLRKPFRFNDLLEKIQSQLGENPL
jgi:DNA-binding response OmpR family regulator